MKVTETLNFVLDIDDETIVEYFDSLDEDETPSILNLMSFIYNNYYTDDFIIEEESPDYEGDETELLELYNEYKR